MYATKIQMKPGCRTSNNLQEIDSIYIEGYPFYRFAKKSEALEWERNFKLKENQSISMNLKSFVDIYLTNLSNRCGAAQSRIGSGKANSNWEQRLDRRGGNHIGRRYDWG